MSTVVTPEAPAAGNRTAKIAVVGLGVVIGVLGLVATFLPRPTPDIAYRMLAVDLSRADQVTVTFEVEKAPLASAECQVAAFNDAKGELRQAWRLNGVLIGPSATGQRVSRHTVVVPTSSQASSAAIAQCVITRTR